MTAEYDMVVIGGGAAGLTAAGMSAVLGAKTALVSDALLGGDCTWQGCVPSKSLLRSARLAQDMRSASDYGLVSAEPDCDWQRVIGRVHAIRQHLYEDADAPPNMEKLGVEVFATRARFIDPHTVEIAADKTSAARVLSSRRFVIATGSRPEVPQVAGIDQVQVLTNENLFEQTERPQRLLILGAGPIGMEMAQAFRRLGSEVTVVGRSARILARDDAELAGMLQRHLEAEGIQFLLGQSVKRLERGLVRLENGAQVAFDAVLVAAGRRPNVETLHLTAAGVHVTTNGISVDRRCRTSVRHIYACGDVIGKHQFTHMAEHTAKVAVMNAILHVPSSTDEDRVPWCTFTDPELAHVGAGEEELRKRRERFQVYRFPFSKLDRAVTESAATGLIKVFANRGRVLGASILGANAGEMIAEHALAMKANARLSAISSTIHPYPTYALGNRRAADLFTISFLTPFRVGWVKRLFRLRGRTDGILALQRFAE